MQFNGKTVLVTGGTSGVGRHTARLFAGHGATVIITGRDEQRGKAVVAEITASMGELLDTLAAASPLGRAAEPIEIAETIAYLAGDTASYLTGAVIPVDGGRVSAL